MKFRQVKIPQLKIDYFRMGGGLDTESAALSIKPGCLIDVRNYEPVAAGTYRRINGIEAFDGRTSPSSAGYWNIGCTIHGTVAVGNTITGGTSAATGYVLQVNAAELILTAVTGTFVTGEALKVATVTQATSTTTADGNSALTVPLHAAYRNLAADYYRTLILAVPGTGNILGVHQYKGVKYAFRANAGDTAVDMYKSSSAGWVQVALGREMTIAQRSATVTITIATPGVISWTAHGAAANQAVVFATTGALPTGLVAGTTYYVLAPNANDFTVAATSGGAAIATSGSQSGTHTAVITPAQISDGAAITGVTSGATATVTRSVLRSGAWTNAPVGALIMATVTGTFTSGEAIRVGGLAKVQATSTDTAITLAKGGRYEFVNYNFTGYADTQRMYGCDGANRAFEFDGTTFVPIATGMTTDKPVFITAHKNSLFLTFRGSLQFSSVGNPYMWALLSGANEIGMGDVITGLLPVVGNSTAGSLAVFTRNAASILYGTSSIDFVLNTVTPDAGCVAYTLQNLGVVLALDDRGVRSLTPTQAYGNFADATVTQLVQTLIDSKQGTAVASSIHGGKNQYRLYFSDGTVLVIGMLNHKVTGITQLDYGIAATCVTSGENATGAEEVFFGSSTGMVYQADKGTSLNGSAIEAWIRTAYSTQKSQLVKKSYKRIVLEMDAEGSANFELGYDLGYGSPNTEPAARVTFSESGGGGYWDQFTWEAFTWDAQHVATPQTTISGMAENISLLVYSNNDYDDPWTIQGASVYYIPRRLARG